MSRPNPARRSGADNRGKRPGGNAGKRTGGNAGKQTAGKRDAPRQTPTVDRPREIAAQVLRAVRERDAYANLVLPGLLRKAQLDARDAAFATELTYGTSRAVGIIDPILASASGRRIEDIDPVLLDPLRLGAYQLLRTRVPAHAAVATSVDLAAARTHRGATGFVNAVLRRMAERTEAQWLDRLAPSADDDPIGNLAFRTAHPRWIAQAFADALGSDAGELADLLGVDDERPQVHLTALPGFITAEELALTVGGSEGPYSPYAVHLDSGDPAALEPVRQHLARVQDEGSQLVARALSLAPLEGADAGRWLDLCAGPGGKSALLGALVELSGGRLDAVEPAAHRAELVEQATEGLPVTVHVADGRDSGLAPGYDRILVDAPCTGLGALRRRPESRWRRTPSDVAELATLQRQLLDAAIALVRPGGVVLYSTCSPHLPETRSIVADAVRRHRLEQLDTQALMPGVPRQGEGPSSQLWPHRHGTDAMFSAALRKPITKEQPA